MRRRSGFSKSNVIATMFLVTLCLCHSACLSSSGGADASIVVDARKPDTAHRESPAPIDLPPTGNCEPFTNLGCAPGNKCTALQQSDGTLALGCDSVGSKAEGEACTQVMVSSGAVTVQVEDDCAAGLACFSTQADAEASCRRMCKSDGSQVCPSGETCILATSSLPSVEFCRVTGSCSPVEQTGCGAGQACYWSSPGALCATAGSGKVGDPCVNANDCVPGATCLALSPSRCAAFCSTAGTFGCPSGTTCAAIASDASAASVGYCK